MRLDTATVLRPDPLAAAHTRVVTTVSAPRIAFDDVGVSRPPERPVLVFLPGWCGSRALFRDLLAAQPIGRRALAIDLRGHGASASGPGDFGYPELLDDTLRVLDAAGVERIIPVGVSHAGWAAIDLRRRLGPRRVPGVVLLDWMVLGPPPPFAAALAGLQDPRGWRAARDRLFAMWTAGVTAPALHAFIEEMRATDGTMWARGAREIAARFATEPVPLAALAKEPVPCPTLHLYAQPADPALLAAQEAYAAANPWFQVHRLTASSHFPMFEVPGEMVARIEAFATAAGRRTA
jgi:pimeloyl-ACP methyl ester carboxylesterase